MGERELVLNSKNRFDTNKEESEHIVGLELAPGLLHNHGRNKFIWDPRIGRRLNVSLLLCPQNVQREKEKEQGRIHGPIVAKRPEFS